MKAAADKAAAIKAAERAAKKAADDAAARAKALAGRAKAATKKGAGKADDAADDVPRSCPVKIPHSFVAGTPVKVDERAEKPIEQIQPGDPLRGRVSGEEAGVHVRRGACRGGRPGAA